jgi:hypothetical protein
VLQFAVASSNMRTEPLTKEDLINLRKRGLTRPRVRNLTKFNSTGDIKPFPVHIDNRFPLLDANIACGNTKASARLHIDVAARVEAQVKFSHMFVGTIIPPGIQDVRYHPKIASYLTDAFHFLLRRRSLEASCYLSTVR